MKELQVYFTDSANRIFRAALLDSFSIHKPSITVKLSGPGWLIKFEAYWRVQLIVHQLHKKIASVCLPAPSKKTVAEDLCGLVNPQLDQECSLRRIDTDSLCEIEFSPITVTEDDLRKLLLEAANSLYRSACENASCAANLHEEGLEDVSDVADSLWNKLKQYGNTRTKKDLAKEIWSGVESKLDRVPEHRIVETTTTKKGKDGVKVVTSKISIYVSTFWPPESPSTVSNPPDRSSLNKPGEWAPSAASAASALDPYLV
jgi:hypothetical protein